MARCGSAGKAWVWFCRSQPAGAGRRFASARWPPATAEIHAQRTETTFVSSMHACASMTVHGTPLISKQRE